MIEISFFCVIYIKETYQYNRFLRVGDEAELT
uniref:Uncharacterized protein n=1 Tax=Lepeophtheirus salmonis TaxID=72036 RepID=A0A0K2U311_LEPSM